MSEFEDHNDLLYCGDCPYLESKPAHKVYVDYPEDHIKGTFIQKQRNKCLLRSTTTIDIWKGSPQKKVAEYSWFSLYDGKNPKRHPGCLVLAKHIHNQLVKEKKWKGHVDAECDHYFDDKRLRDQQ